MTTTAERYGIRFAWAGGRRLSFDVSVAPGSWLRSFDPGAFAGRGQAIWTADADEAMTFESPGDAMSFWRQQSTVRPTRPDGKPNRPLTAYTVEIVKVP